MKTTLIILEIITVLIALKGWLAYYGLRLHYRKLYEQFEKLNQTYIKFVHEVDSTVPNSQDKFFIAGAAMVCVCAVLAWIFGTKDE